MRYGWVLPNGDAATAAELAALAEAHGWDGFFVWDAIWAVDAWIALAAAAMRTSRIRLGTMLTPLPRRNPWDVASQTATVDNLSGGRVQLSVGLGAADERWWLFEDDPGRRVRAERLDEGLELLQQLWRSELTGYEGRHFRARATEQMLPPPVVQAPRIPVWVVGSWPRPRSMRRAARWDGWIPSHVPVDGSSGEVTPALVAEGLAWIQQRRAAEGLDGRYDVVVEGTTPTDPAAGAEQLRPWAEAGATWWLEADWSNMDPEAVRHAAAERLTAGPPRAPA